MALKLSVLIFFPLKPWGKNFFVRHLMILKLQFSYFISLQADNCFIKELAIIFSYGFEINGLIKSKILTNTFRMSKALQYSQLC